MLWFKLLVTKAKRHQERSAAFLTYCCILTGFDYYTSDIKKG